MIDDATAQLYIEKSKNPDALSGEERSAMADALDEYQNHKDAEAQQAQYLAGKAKADKWYDGIDTMGGNWTKSLQYAYEPLMGGNIQEGKARFANQVLLANETGRTPEEVGAAGYEILRDEYARRNFDGNIPKTDLDFYNAYKGKRDKDRAADTLWQNMTNTASAGAVKDALSGAEPDWGTHYANWSGANGANPAMNDLTRTPEMDASVDGATPWESAPLDLKFGLDYMRKLNFLNNHPELKPITEELMKAAGRADLSPSPKPSLTDITGTTIPGMEENPSPQFNGPDLMKVADDLSKVPSDTRLDYLRLVKSWMAADKVKDPDGVLGRLAEATMQLTDASARGADKAWGSRREAMNGDLLAGQILTALDNGEDIRLVGDKVDLGNVVTLKQYTGMTYMQRSMAQLPGGAPVEPPTFDQMGRPLTQDEKDQIRNQAVQTQEKYQTYRDVYRIANENINPIRPVLATSRLGQSAEMNALYGPAEFAAPMIAAGVAGSINPWAGAAVMADAMKSQFYNDARDAGMSPESADLFAGVAAPIAGGFGMLRVNALKGTGWLVNRLPWLSRAVANATTTEGRYTLPFLIRAGAGSAEQAVDMSAMNAAPEAAKWLMQGFANDMPATQFSQVTDAMTHSMSDPGTWFAALPFALVGAGAAGYRDFRTTEDFVKNPERQRQMGLTDEAIQQGQELIQSGDVTGAAKVVMKAYMDRTEEQKAQAAENTQQEADRALAVQQSSLTPTLRQEGDRWAVINPDGQKTLFESPESARMYIEDRTRWMDEHEAQTQSAFLDIFQKEDQGRGLDQSRLWEPRDQEKNQQDAIEAGEVTPEQVAESMDIAGIKEGNPANVRIYGENVATIKGNMYTDVSRIYKGANWADVLHERGHSEYKLARHEGRLTAEDAETGARVWLERDGSAVPEKLSERQVDEAMADMQAAHVTGQLKKGTALWKVLPQGVRSFLSQLRQYFSGVFKKAAQLEALRKEGKLPKSVEDFLAQSLKIDDQVNHNKGVKAEAEKMLGKPLAESSAVKGPASFSIGKIKDRSDVWRKSDVAVVKIDSSKFPGKKKDWHQVIRQWFSDNLQGKTITNDHSGLRIKFNSESRSESSGKLRHEEAFRSLKSAEQIVKEALYLDSSRAKDAKRSNAYHYFTVPVEVDGKIYTAWFNVREPKAKDPNSDGVFYEFGVDGKNEMASARPVTDHRLSQEGVASTSKPRVPIAQFLESVKGSMESHIPPKPGIDISHSIGTESYLDRLDAMVQATLRTPEERILFQEKAKANLSELTRTGGTLDRLVRLDEQKSARQTQLEEDMENRRADLERDIEELHRQRDEQIAKAGEANTVKYGDRIEAARTDHERALLEREARESAAADKAGITKDFRRQEQALKERAKADERAIKEKALGKDRADEMGTDFEDRREAMLQSFKALDAILMAVPPDERGRVGGFVKMATLKTDAARLKYLEDRVEKIQTVMEKSLRKQYGEAMEKLLKRSQPQKAKAGKTPVGKLGADVHSLFQQIKEAMDWTPEEATAHADALRTKVDGGELTPEQEAHEKLEAEMMELVADWKNADASRRSAAVENATRIFKDGYAENLFKGAAERTARKETRQRLITETGKTGTASERDARMAEGAGFLGKLKGAKDKLQALWRGISSFEQVMKLSFGDGSKDAQRLADAQQEADFQKFDMNQADADKVDSLFSRLAGGPYKGEKLHWKMTRKNLKVQGRQLSELEAITATLMWHQEDGRRHMEGIRDENGKIISSWHYDQGFVDEIEKKLSHEAKVVREFFIKEYSSEYAAVNALYRALNGVDLPHNPNYAPLTVKPLKPKSGNVIDPVTGMEMSAASATPGSLKTRGHSVSEPDFKDALTVFMQHKAQINHWLAYGKLAREMQSILGNREVLNAVEAKAGKAMADTLQGWTEYLVQGGNRDAAARLELTKMLSRMVSRGTSIALVGRLGVLPIQSSQLAAALAEMPTGAYTVRLAKLMTGNLGWGNAVDSAYIQRRLKEMPPVVRQAFEGLRSEKPSLLKHAMQKVGQTISGADALFTAGTYAIIRDYRLTRLLEDHPDLSRAEVEATATKEAERITDRLAQPMRAGARSLYELNATGPLARMAWNFSSDSRKNLGLLLYAMAQRPMAEKMRTAAFVLILNSLIANVIRAAWRDARDDDDNEVFDEKNWGIKRMALAVATEPVQGVPVLGPILQDAIYKGAGAYNLNGSVLSGLPQAVPAAKRLATGDEEDAEHSLKDVESVLTGMGLVNSDIAAAASLSHLVRDLYGVEKNATK